MIGFDHETGQTLSIDGAQLYFEVRGRKQDPPLLLLHGGLGTMADVNPIIERLSSSYRVVGIDARGHGRSTLGTSGLSYERMQHDVERIAAALELSKLEVIGFSDGGITGLRAAVSGKLAIGKLVVIGTPAELEAPNREIYQRLTARGWRQKFSETYEHYQTLNPQPDFDAFVTAAVRAWLDTSDHGYPGDSVSRISSQVLVVRGDEDHMVSRASAFKLAQAIPNARLLNVPYASHVVHDDQPEILMTVVNRFLSER